MEQETTAASNKKPTSSLPQPLDTTNQQPYKYILYDELESTYWNNKNNDNNNSTLPEDTLCWVLTSKGQRKSQRNKQKNLNDDDDNVEQDDKEEECHRTELFNRARVVYGEEEEEYKKEHRVLVRYPKGSTYHVRRCNLIPVLEPSITQDKIVLVVPETPQYRRLSAVHTCINESFLEIGCDFGPCVNRVRTVLEDVGFVAKLDEDLSLPEEEEEGDEKKEEKCVRCLGIDKSVTSLDIACKRYPNTSFSLEDALTKAGTSKLRSLCKRKLIDGYPSVVAVDINGNRELEHVLKCLECLMQPGDDVVVGEDWHLPRLIIVKSRFLYQYLKEV
uniref:Uncharacterized protein n=1 Tax=Ditylum brightwellii TaxID=49249 RepID=A0A7S4S4B7_9STRA